MISYRRHVDGFCCRKEQCMSDLHREICKNVDSGPLYPELLFWWIQNGVRTCAFRKCPRTFQKGGGGFFENDIRTTGYLYWKKN